MSQTPTSSYDAQSAAQSKAVDFAFVIAGWPTVYTVVKKDYTLAGDLAGFSTIENGADLPVVVGAVPKGRPEEGPMTIGEMEITLADRRSAGVRGITELLSREWHKEQDVLDPIPKTLDGDLSMGASDIKLNSLSNVATSGVAYVGLEAVSYSGLDTGQKKLLNCVRGYRLTSATPHVSGTHVYFTEMPTLDRQRAFLYKGYQNLGLEHWLPAFGGVLTGISKRGPSVTFTVMSTTWHTYDENKSYLNMLRASVNTLQPGQDVTVESVVLSGDYAGISIDVPVSAPDLGLGHYLLNIGGHWVAITGAT